MKLKAKIDRKPKGWKITSIRIPFETAQKVESLGIRAGVRSATETIIQLLEQATASVKALPVGKLEWAKKADASARKDYTKKPAKKAKTARKAKAVKAKSPKKVAKAKLKVVKPKVSAKDKGTNRATVHKEAAKAKESEPTETQRAAAAAESHQPGNSAHESSPA